MARWLECLINPRKIVLQRRHSLTRSDERFAVALLLDGRLFEYHRLSEGLGLPALVSASSKPVEKGSGLLSVLVAYLGGREVPTDSLFALFEDESKPLDFQLLARILAAVVLGDAGRAKEAADVVAGFVTPDGPRESALAMLHSGFRLAELGEWQDALSATRSAIETIAERKDTMSRVVLVIARHNEWTFSERLGQVSVPDLPSRSSLAPLVELTELEAEAGSKYLDDAFTRSLRDARGRGFAWRAEDPVESRLSAALLRAECLADWRAVKRLRQLLGQYGAIEVVAGESSGVDRAIQLFRRAGDDKRTKTFVSFLRRSGPLEPFSRVVDRIAQETWTAVDIGPILQILQAGATLLDADSAGSATKRLRTHYSQFGRGPLSRFEHEFIKAAAAIIRDSMIDPVERDATMKWFHELASTSHDPLVLQEISYSLDSKLIWEEISDQTADEWLSFGISNVIAKDDRLFVARSALLGLHSRLAESVESTLLTAFSATPSLSLGGALISTGADLPPEEVERLGDLAIKQVNKKQTDAAKLSFSVGMGYNAAAIVAYLCLSQNLDRWDDIESFLLDPNVPVSEKLPVLETIFSDLKSLPERVRGRIASELPSLRGPTDPMLGREEDWNAITLIFLSQLGAVGTDSLLAEVVQVASAPNASVRLVAARALSSLASSLQGEAMVTLALALSHDSDVSVRSQAAYGLAAVPWEVDELLQQVVNARVEAQIIEDGIDVPFAVLNGIRDGVQLGKQFTESVWNRVDRIRSAHPAETVRRLADSARALKT